MFSWLPFTYHNKSSKYSLPSGKPTIKLRGRIQYFLAFLLSFFWAHLILYKEFQEKFLSLQETWGQGYAQEVDDSQYMLAAVTLSWPPFAWMVPSLPQSREVV